jgi:hypothetical protein
MPSLEAHLLSPRRSSLTTGHFSPGRALDSHKSHSERIDREKALERNIDNVVLGDVMFKSWYPSWYPKEIIGEKALTGDGKGIVVQTLYVCKRCFAYSKVVEEWVKHTRLCEKEVPGRRIYVHDAKQGVWNVWEVDGGADTVSSFPVTITKIINVYKTSNFTLGVAILSEPESLCKALLGQ